MTADAGKKSTDGAELNSAPHPAWLAFMQFCMEMKYGEIERLSIHNGLPVLAETAKRKIKFTE